MKQLKNMDIPHFDKRSDLFGGKGICIRVVNSALNLFSVKSGKQGFKNHRRIFEIGLMASVEKESVYAS